MVLIKSINSYYTYKSPANYTSVHLMLVDNVRVPCESTVYSVQCPVSRVQCPVYSVQSPVSRVQCPVYSVQSPVYRVQCPEYSVQCTVYRVQCPESSVQCTVSRVQCPEYSVQCPVYRVQCPVSSVQFNCRCLLTGRCCRNSRSTSMSFSVLSAGSFSKHSRTVSRTIRDYKRYSIHVDRKIGR